MSKGDSGLFTGTRGNPQTQLDLEGAAVSHRLVYGFPTSLHEGRQGKHIPGHNNYDEEVGRSIFNGSLEDAQRLIDEFAGTGYRNARTGNKETIDFGFEIGAYADRRTGEMKPTTRGTIHYSKDGAHIVPSRPKRGSL